MLTFITMIYDSVPWKNQLSRERQLFLRELYIRKRFTDSVYVMHERLLFVTAFVIRKLFNSMKISDEIENHKLECKRYKIIDSISLNKILPYKDEVSEHYDLSNEEVIVISVKDICNLFIHSYFFQCEFSYQWKDINNTVIFFNSDYIKKSFVFSINLSTWLTFIRLVEQDNIVAAHWSRGVIIKKSNKDF